MASLFARIFALRITRDYARLPGIRAERMAFCPLEPRNLARCRTGLFTAPSPGGRLTWKSKAGEEERAWRGRRPCRRRPGAFAALGSVAGVVLLLVAAVAAPAQAAAGDLDVSFSDDGKQPTDFGTGESRAAAVVRQPDGKIVAVGESHGNFALARYNTDGSLDTSFSGDGRQDRLRLSHRCDRGGAPARRQDRRGRVQRPHQRGRLRDRPL